MFKIKVFIYISIFSFLLIVTSFIKNQTREIEKDIYNINSTINKKERDLNESQLDFSYLTSPSIIESKIKHLDSQKYITMDFSSIFLSFDEFNKIQNKFVIQNNRNEKNIQKK